MHSAYALNDDAIGMPASQENRWLAHYAYLVRRVCSHLRSQVSAGFDQDDIEQVGLMGLLEALRRYGEPDAGFEGFAFKRIRGAILDELRRQDWRPRRVRQAAHDLNQHQRTLLNRLGRAPTDEELASAAGLSLEEVRELHYANQAEQMQCLEDWLAKGGDLSSNQQQRMETEETIAHALSQMDERERLLVALYYQHELNMKEIALTLGLTESRVCQLHKECLASLNRILRG